MIWNRKGAASYALPFPGLVWGQYPENHRPEKDRPWADRLDALALYLDCPGLNRYQRIAHRSLEIEHDLSAVSGVDFDEAVRQLKQRSLRDGLNPENMALAFALTGLACQRHLGMQPFATQRTSAAIMLDNQLSEMATGEGKTLAIMLTAAAGALAGIPVHVITANEYLVDRDATQLAPVYEALGLRVGSVLQRMDSNARRTAYGCDITYCTAKELVFDYLRDLPARWRHRTDLSRHAADYCAGSSQRETLLRGLCMAIIDEADSILIDEARVPLIISELRENEGRHRVATEVLALAGTLRPGIHFTLDHHGHSAALTDQGRASIDGQMAGQHGIWRNRRHRDESICLALAALHIFQRDRHYLVRHDGVHIIDETTGRVAPGRSWSRGLHQFIELKERCSVSGETVTRAQITYQRFFPRYVRLCGMSGTLAESRGELASVYGLKVLEVPLRRPCQRVELGRRVFHQRARQWQAVTDRLTEMQRQGRPVLIGTDSVADSESLSAHLIRRGVAHNVLNAHNDRQEAAIIAQAGQAGRVTVATNMAGRGTDIPLGPGVAQMGGLHVISCQLNGARRIDRQLMGRSARQGDPGSVETLLCLESPLMRCAVPAWLMRWAENWARLHDGELPDSIGRLLIAITQRMEESRQKTQRALLRHQDRQLDRLAVFKE